MRICCYSKVRRQRYSFSCQNTIINNEFLCITALPLFNRTDNFSRHLELFDQCQYYPTSDHPLVKEWASPPNGPATTDINTNAAAIGAAAACALSETGLDTGAFGDSLATIQKASVARK
jgi:dual specificity phosphatase 12